MLEDSSSDDSRDVIYYPQSYFYNWKFRIIITNFCKFAEGYSGTRATFVTAGDTTEFMERFEVSLYANGCNSENRGNLSILFVENENGHLNTETISYTFRCIVSLVDNEGVSKFPQSFAITRRGGIDEENYQEPYTPFGIERFIDAKRILQFAEEYISEDKLTLLLDISFLEGYHIDSVYSANIFRNVSCDEDIEVIRESDGTMKYKLSFDTALFEYLQKESTYFQSVEEIPMVEASNKFLFICDEEYPAFCRLAKFVSMCTLRHIESIDDFAELYVIADKYGLLRVKGECLEHLKNILTYENAADVLVLADMLNDGPLKASMIHYIKSTWPNITPTEGWINLVEMHPNLTEEILKDVSEIETDTFLTNGITEIDKNGEARDLEIFSYFS